MLRHFSAVSGAREWGALSSQRRLGTGLRGKLERATGQIISSQGQSSLLFYHP